ncbi:MAG: FAD-dependent oxidoreductase [Ruminococcaceae bacterium]|nr:FAD-dependent oxidoreductase [Oscillospiraceae bacterium]
MSTKIIEPARELAVTDSCDVLVCGGGVAGIASALAAARQGARVILLEREYMLGGLATLGLVIIYLPICDGCGHQVSFGIAEELLRLSISHGIVVGHYPKPWFEDGTLEERIQCRYEVNFNPNVFAIEAERLLVEAGVTVLYGTIAAETVVENDKISAVIIENKSGRSAITSKSVIDCTGDADICKLAGADTAVYAPGNKLSMWHFRKSPDCVWFQTRTKLKNYDETVEKLAKQLNANTRASGIDAMETSKWNIMTHQILMQGIVEARENNAEIEPITCATIPQFLMTRRIAGAATPDISISHKRMESSIGMAAHWYKAGPVFELPYECLFGNRIKNLITAGRNISVADDLWDITRCIPVCAVTGEAAGIAAALTDDFASLDVKILQNKLREAGVKLHCSEVLPGGQDSAEVVNDELLSSPVVEDHGVLAALPQSPLG